MPPLLALLTLAACAPSGKRPGAQRVALPDAPPPPAARAAPIGAAGDARRTGWYPNQPLLDPDTVAGGTFGRLFDTVVDGQVYVQPLVSNGVLLVATETNWVYGLDPASGDVLWSRSLGVPWSAADLNCGDLSPTIGVTGTPAIDPDNATAYLFSKTYATGSAGDGAWYAHALDLSTGDERPGFPVAIAGSASNEPAQVFQPMHQMQRPGLLLMGDVVYAAFGGHCDSPPYAGWIVGVATAGRVTTMWTTEAGPARSTGGAIWQSGGALVSDGPGQILFATGNDLTDATSPIPGDQPPGALGEAVVRVTVQPDGSLRATDFFSPQDAATLNERDYDFGSGAPVALPAVPFGTSGHPNVLVQIGKSGYGYLLDRDHLGGIAQGAEGDDDVLQRFGPDGGVWSKASVWPGDGGYLYVPTAIECAPDNDDGCLHAYHFDVTGDGTPHLSLAATAPDAFNIGSSAAVVTSDGMRSGSAVVWIVWSSGWFGLSSELRAYDAVPRNGTLDLRFATTIGGGAKYAMPGVGDNRIYVGTRDGHVLGFGIAPGP